jgi:hypothetical protein
VQYLYKDFATGDQGTAFDFVMEKYGLNLPDACALINKELKLGLDGRDIEAKEQFKPEPKIEEERNYNYRTYPKPWSRHELDYWSQAGIGRDTLDLLRIRPIKRFWAFNRFGRQYEVKARYDNPLFEYVQNGWSKIYRPFAQAQYESKFYTVGRKDPYYIFGLNELPYSHYILAVTGGEKDAAAWIANVGPAICFNSEEANPSDYPNFTRLVTSGRFGRIVFIYDNDETGARQARKMAEMFGCEWWIPKGVGEGGDLFDYFKEKTRV